MSIPSSQSGISFGGLSSGIDTTSIISKLVQLESQPITRFQQQQTDLSTKQGVYTQLQTALSALAQAGGSLNSSNAFNPVGAVSSDTTVATLTGSSSAGAGSYSLSVTALAQAQKLASQPQADVSSGLGFTGSAVINGHAFSVTASDSIQSIAQKINGLQANVTASVIDGGTGSAYLTLNSSATGASHKIQLNDLTGSVFQALGVVSGSDAVRETITNGATSLAFNDTTSTVQSLLGTSGMGPTSFSINGTSVNVDPSTDSLQAMADKINTAAITGVSASVRSVQASDGTTTYKLDIKGASTPTFSDPNHVLESVGILQQPATKELVPAQDAAYTLDGVALTSATNTVTTAIPGATLTLLKGTAATPGTSTLTMSRDTGAIKTSLQSFANAYNNVVDFIASNSKFDTKSFASGPLFGDAIGQQIGDSITQMLFNNVPGITGAYNNLASIGFSLDTIGHLQIDDKAVSAALASKPDDVGALFRATGKGSTSEIQFVSSTSKSKPSSVGSYALSVTQPATKASFVAGTVPTSPSTTSEKLTFNGALFGQTPYSLNLDIGSTLSSTIAKINSDSKLKDLIFASVDTSGALRIDSKKFGSTSSFSVVSNFASSTSNSGIGPGGEGTTTAGLDIAGTINGEVATGNGQFLTGKSGNATTDGLQVQYTGNSTGAVGSLSFSKGVGSLTNDTIGTFTDSVNGLITIANKSIQTQIDDVQSSIDALNTRLASYQEELKLKYANMETAIAGYQSQAQSLGGLTTKSA